MRKKRVRTRRFGGVEKSEKRRVEEREHRSKASWRDYGHVEW